MPARPQAIEHSSQDLKFPDIDRWPMVPSPKIHRSDITGVYTWAPFYAAFSERFASAAIHLMRGGGCTPVVLDPFVGGGTSVLASAKLGLPVVGIDLDPFAALLSRARIAIFAEAKLVHSLLATALRPKPSQFCGTATELFRSTDLDFASAVFERLVKRVPASKDGSIFKTLLDDPAGEFDSEAVALAALCLASEACAKVVRSSNPVWFRAALPGEIERAPKLPTAARSAASTMLEDLAQLAPTIPKRRIQLLNEDFRQTSLATASVDMVLTSPPYLNRLDYVISHLAPLSILSGLLPISMEELRRAMIGTTKMVEKGKVPHQWGKACIQFLEAVAKHPSKASDTYYFWTYFQYFKDLSLCLRNLTRIVRPGAIGAFVIQNSFYKEIPVPTPKIILEMADAEGIRARIVRTEVVRSHLGTMSPRQTRYVPRKVLEECVVAMEFPKPT